LVMTLDRLASCGRAGRREGSRRSKGAGGVEGMGERKGEEGVRGRGGWWLGARGGPCWGGMHAMAAMLSTAPAPIPPPSRLRHCLGAQPPTHRLRAAQQRSGAAEEGLHAGGVHHAVALALLDGGACRQGGRQGGQQQGSQQQVGQGTRDWRHRFLPR
jgi:hypothetical protein